MINNHMAYKTFYKPINPKKYIGDFKNIICRSLWERRICKFFDENSSILKWSSEEIAIPYMHPIKQKMFNYYPDFMVQFKNNEGTHTWILEVKPKKQTYLRENSTKNEKMTWAVNSKKWEAAHKYCEKNNLTFKIITEKELFNNAN